MDGYSAATYGDSFASVYDRWYHGVTDTGACVERLATLAGAGGAPGSVLELGVGTGRLALPLVARGVAVTGVDSSEAMLDGLRAKPGAGAVHLVTGDMADLDHTDPPLEPGPAFDVAVIAFNTLFNVVSEPEVRSCLAGVARRLRPGGHLVVEAVVPIDDPSGRRDGVAVSRLESDEVVLTATIHDPEHQTITGQHVQITTAGITLRPWHIRYLRPAQLDALAAACGLVLEGREADWSGAPFDDASATHVSTYRLAPAGGDAGS